MKVSYSWLIAAAAMVAPARADSPRPAGPRLLHVPSNKQRVEQGILTPVPVALEMPSDLPARRVLLHYHVFGSQAWRTLELRHASASQTLDRDWRRYLGAIPCLEVSTITGEIRYYIRVHDAEGAVIAFSGTRSHPYRVEVHHQSERPDLAASAGEVRCPDPSDCPPGLPGCPSAAVELIPCQQDRDCEGGKICGWESFCEDDSRLKNWFGLEITQGVGALATRGVCSVVSQENDGYACYRSRDGSVYTGRPVYSDEPVRFGLAPTRVLLSYERLLFYDTSLGLRMGYAFAGSGPTLPGAAGFVPYSIELLARYWPGNDPFAQRGLRPYLFVGAGAGQFDIKVNVHVREDPSKPHSQAGNDLEQTLSASKRAGDAFISLGAGILLPISEHLAPALEVSACQAFPFAATVVSASAGLRLGI